MASAAASRAATGGSGSGPGAPLTLMLSVASSAEQDLVPERTEKSAVAGLRSPASQRIHWQYIESLPDSHGITCGSRKRGGVMAGLSSQEQQREQSLGVGGAAGQQRRHPRSQPGGWARNPARNAPG